MSTQYTRDHVKVSVAKILQALGWHSINSTPLEVLTDILCGFLTQLTKSTNDYANEFGQTDPNLDHLALSFRDMGISLSELEEYVTYVNFGPPPSSVPKYPIPKDNHLNFLKPGSKEVVTRPVHIHEHLPPMYPLLEGTENDSETVEVKKEDEENAENNGQVFKKPAEISPTEFKRARREDEGSRPTREISSVMMTTSGFLSPAREGKLPEAKAPIQALMDPPIPPNNSSVQNIEVNGDAPPKKVAKVVNRKVEKKKDKIGKELFKPLLDDKPVRKSPPISKMKQKPNMVGGMFNIPHFDGVKISPIPNSKISNKINKTLADARLKTEKLNTTITPIPIKEEQLVQNAPSNIDKINTEPDKKKVNIFRKISNVKNEKNDVKSIKKEDSRSRGGSPNLIIDEREDVAKNIPNLPSDVTIEPIPPTIVKSPEKMDYFDDGSPPGTPSTPKTPEMISHSPPLTKEKRKRKEGKRARKVQKQSPVLPVMEHYMELERPKTPEAQLTMKEQQIHNTPSQLLIPPLFNLLGGPGLIPSPMFPFPSIHPSFGKSPLFPSMHPNLSNLPNPLQSPLSNHLSPKIEESPPMKQPKIEPPLVSPAPEPPTVAPPVTDTPADIMPVDNVDEGLKPDKKNKKEKKDKIKKKNKKDKIKDKSEKKKMKEEKKVKDKIKKEKKDKKKDKDIRDGESPVPKLFLKLGTPSPRPETPDAAKKLNIKPIIKKEGETETSEERHRETSPGLAKISALVTGPPKPKTSQLPIPAPQIHHPNADETIEEDGLHIPVPKNGPGPGRPRIHPPKTKPSPPKTKKQRRTSIKKDADGKEIWICPACNLQDDGSPMIGCDGCDAWYHWVCVKIQVPPDENENWYCKHCLPKNNDDLQTDKKKKRKKREKKEH